MAVAKGDYERYLHDITRFPRITVERERELSAKILNGRKAAAIQRAVDELIEGNLLLVVHCLRDFRKYLDSPACRITEMDLIAEGNIGLMKAARNFNAEHEYETDDGEGRSHTRFSTYACTCIKSYMRRALRLARFIHIPEYHFTFWTRVRELEDVYGEDIDDGVMMQALDISPVVLAMVKQGLGVRTSSLEDLGRDGGVGWADLLPSATASRPDEAAQYSDLRSFLEREMVCLPERMRRMLTMLYLEESKSTFSELAEVFGVSKERCRQVCARGLELLRQQIEPKLRRGEINVGGHGEPDDRALLSALRVSSADDHSPLTLAFEGNPLAAAASTAA